MGVTMTSKVPAWIADAIVTTDDLNDKVGLINDIDDDQWIEVIAPELDWIEDNAKEAISHQQQRLEQIREVRAIRLAMTLESRSEWLNAPGSYLKLWLDGERFL